MSMQPNEHLVPAVDPAGSTAVIVGVVFGGAAVISALIINGYLAIAVSIIGLFASFIARSRLGPSRRLVTTAIALNSVGLVLGVVAQLMKAIIVAFGG